MDIELAPGGYAVFDVSTGDRHEFAELPDKLPWRWNDFPPHEPRMPPHQYVDGHHLGPEEAPVARMLEFIIAKHPESYTAYFRGYQSATRYLEIGDGWRYWRVWIGGASFPHRQRLDAAEPPRRVDEGAKKIPPERYGAQHPYWPSGYGEWKKEEGEW